MYALQLAERLDPNGTYDLLGGPFPPPPSSCFKYEHPELEARISRITGLNKAKSRVLFEDMLKFLWLSVTSGKKLAPTAIIDSAWHEFILYTKDYHNFCQKNFGRYLHHMPNPRKDGFIPLIEQGNLALELAKVTFTDLSENWHLSHDVNASESFDCSPDFDCDSQGGSDAD